VGSPAEDSIGAIVERVEKGDHVTALGPGEAGPEEISRELSWQLATRIVPGQRKLGSIQRF
jgi:hypothetical protein